MKKSCEISAAAAEFAMMNAQTNRCGFTRVFERRSLWCVIMYTFTSLQVLGGRAFFQKLTVMSQKASRKKVFFWINGWRFNFLPLLQRKKITIYWRKIHDFRRAFFSKFLLPFDLRVFFFADLRLLMTGGARFVNYRAKKKTTPSLMRDRVGKEKIF